VTEEAARHGGGPVLAVHLQLGRLSGVVREALLFAYDRACDGTALEGSELRIEEVEGNGMLIVRMELDS